MFLFDHFSLRDTCLREKYIDSTPAQILQYIYCTNTVMGSKNCDRRNDNLCIRKDIISRRNEMTMATINRQSDQIVRIWQKFE